MQNEIYCNNCGKNGHLYHQCKLPITSVGIVVFRVNNNLPEYLMIRRKDTLGHVDFMRGKYSLNNKEYILNVLNQMTIHEKELISNNNFNTLWNNVWGGNTISNQYKNEENNSREKFNALKEGVIFNNQLTTLCDLIEESNNLISLHNDTAQGEIIYRLTFDNKNQLNSFKKKIEGIKSINKINISLV